MKIDRHNCEAFFLDYHEKNLTPVQVAELLFFLEENPDLKELFGSYAAIALEAERIPFPNKEALKRKLTPDEIDRELSGPVTAVNAGLFLIARTEGVLNTEQEFRLTHWLSAHPGQLREQRLLEKCRLEAGDETFAFKDQLKKAAITSDNCEEYFIRAAEKDLAPYEERALAAFLQEQPALRRDYELYTRTILPAEAIVFEDKAALKKRKRRPVVIALLTDRRVYYAAAAAILLLAGLFFILRDPSAPETFMADRPASEAASPVPLSSDRTAPTSGRNPEQPVVSAEEPQALASSAPRRKSGGDIAVPDQKHSYNKETLPPGIRMTPLISSDDSEEKILAQEPAPSSLLQPELPVVASVRPADSAKSEDPTSAMAQSAVPASDDGYISAGMFLNRQVRKMLGIRKTDPCTDEEKLQWWDLAMAAKQGIQRLTGMKAVDVNKNCEGEGSRVEYVFTAGNFGVTRSVSR